MAKVVKFETLSYNGFTFPVETMLTISANPIKDDANRTVARVEHVLTAEATIQETSNEVSLKALRAKLETQGQQLTLTGTGYGDLSIGAPGLAGTDDLAWGPIPEIVEWEPLGTNACKIVWRCTVSTSPCGIDRGYVAFNYRFSYSTDAQGYTTRTISGYLEIPLSRVGGGSSVRDSAINHINQYEPPLPKNGRFRRTNRQFNESADRRRVEFTFTDEEMPFHILPPDVVDCRASHSVQAFPGEHVHFNATLRASYTLRRGIDKFRASTYFMILLFDRIRAMIEAGTQSIIPMGMSFEDPDIYGRQAANFAFSYHYVLGTKNAAGTLPGIFETLTGVSDMAKRLKNTFTGSALWRPPPVSINNYTNWINSMECVFGKSAPKFLYRVGNDLIVDLCGNLKPGDMDQPYFRITLEPYSDASLFLALKGGVFTKDRVVVRSMTKTQAILRKSFPTNSVNDQTSLKTVNDILYGSGVNEGTPLLRDIQRTAGYECFVTVFFDRVVVGDTPKLPTLTTAGGTTKLQHIRVHDDKYSAGSHFGIRALGRRGYVLYGLQEVPGKNVSFPPSFFVDGVPYDSNVVKTPQDMGL